MKFIWILMVALLITDPIKVNKINSAKKAAKNAFQAGDYQTAVATYKYLIDSLDVKEDEVLLNLAHAQYLLKDTANAFSRYQSLSQSPKNEIASKSNLHLGLMTNQKGKAEEALSYFKQAVRQDPTNEEARYNYEMLKKKLDEQKKKDQQQQKKDQNKEQDKKEEKDKEKQNKEQQKKEDQEKKDQEKKDQENKENKDQKNKDEQKKDQEQKEKEQKEKEEKEKQEQQQQEKDQKEQEKKDMKNLDKEKLDQMKITEEKARMILEAMKNQEKQYLQQNKRKATKSKDRNKPDW
jgi:Ca-activated chloride channel family protein